MSKINTRELSIPSEMLSGWQTIVNLLADIVEVPSALVMRIHDQHIEVFSSSSNTTNPYKTGDSESLGQGLYCETVINEQRELLVPNALSDPEWRDNPDVALGMIAYCGIPINWPDNSPFGTICVLDTQENHFNDLYRQLLASFRDSIESQLTTIYQKEKLQVLNEELRSRVDTRTKDLVDLNYSLNQEIDRRRAAEQEVAYRKRHDMGTGFLNRKALEAELDTQLKSADQNIKPLALIHIGFTNARRVQSKYSYSIWEKVLVQYRERLGDLSQYEAITARPTSTDIVLVVKSQHLDDSLHRLCLALVELGYQEFEVDGEQLLLHSFIGIAKATPGINGTTLLKHATEAMLSCKDSGHKYSFYSQDLSASQSHISQLEGYLLQAVRNDDLLLYFQPKVSPVTHRWSGAEALLRWKHPILGDISNETLIHMAEQNGLIFEVGNFVLRAAIEKAAEWAPRIDDFKLAVNISAMQLKNPLFAEQVNELLHTYQLPAHYLELEVTESSLIADEHVAQNSLEALHQLGVTLSLDDFGTGYSSFNYLKKFPFDAIKIDKSFMQQLDSSDDDKEIVRSIVNVAKKLELKVTVEGIESQQHEQFIIEEGCDFGQGYFYGLPMPCDEFEACLNNQNYTGSIEIRYPQ